MVFNFTISIFALPTRLNHGIILKSISLPPFESINQTVGPNHSVFPLAVQYMSGGKKKHFLCVCIKEFPRSSGHP